MANLHPRKSLVVPGSLGQPKAAIFSFNKFLHGFPIANDPLGPLKP